MDYAALIAELTPPRTSTYERPQPPDRARQQLARDLLLQAGVAALPALLAEICRENTDSSWSIAEIVAPIGDPAFGPLVQTLAETGRGRS